MGCEIWFWKGSESLSPKKPPQTDLKYKSAAATWLWGSKKWMHICSSLCLIKLPHLIGWLLLVLSKFGDMKWPAGGPVNQLILTTVKSTDDSLGETAQSVLFVTSILAALMCWSTTQTSEKRDRKSCVLQFKNQLSSLSVILLFFILLILESDVFVLCLT